MEKVDLEFLMRRPLFENFTQEEIEELKDHISIKKFPQDSLIITEGESTSDIYLIYSGEVDVIKQNGTGPFKLGTLKEGEIFGEMAYLNHRPRSTTIKAVKNTVVYELSQESLDKPVLGKILSKLVKNIAKISIQRVSHSNQQRLLAASRETEAKNVFGKLALYLVSALCIINAAFIFIPIYPNHQMNTYFYWGYAGFAALILLINFPNLREQLGITFKKMDLFLISMSVIVGLLFIAGVKWLLPSLFMVHTPLILSWVLSYALFCLVFEFVNRGILLSSFLEYFEEKPMLTVFLAAFISTFLPMVASYLTIGHVALMFVFNVLFNLIYLKSRSIFTLFAIHYILGLAIVFLGGAPF